MKHLFGAEPALGLFVLLVSLPIVAALAYIVVYGVIQDPISFVIYAALYVAVLLVSHSLRLITQRRRTARSSEQSQI